MLFQVAVRKSLGDKARTGQRSRQLENLLAEGKPVNDPEDDKLWLALESKHHLLEFDYARTWEQEMQLTSIAVKRIQRAWRKVRRQPSGAASPVGSSFGGGGDGQNDRPGSGSGWVGWGLEGTGASGEANVGGGAPGGGRGSLEQSAGGIQCHGVSLQGPSGASAASGGTKTAAAADADGKGQANHAAGGTSCGSVLEGGADSPQPPGVRFEQETEAYRDQFLLEVEENYSSISLTGTGQQHGYRLGLSVSAADVEGKIGNDTSIAGDVASLLLPQFQQGNAGGFDAAGGQTYVTPRIGS